MDAFQQLLIDRTGYPAYRSIAKAARDSGLSQSLLSEYVRGTRKPDPTTLKRFSTYLQRSYNDLLMMVWGDGSQPDTNPGKDRSSTRNKRHYVYQDQGLKFPRLGVAVHAPLSAA